MSAWQTRLKDWADWFLVNHDRLELYFPAFEGRLRQRQHFCHKLFVGDFEVIAALVEQMQTWGKGQQVSRDVIAHIQEVAAWYRREAASVSDPDKGYALVVRTQAKILQCLRLLGEQVDAFEQGRRTLLAEALAERDHAA